MFSYDQDTGNTREHLFGDVVRLTRKSWAIWVERWRISAEMETIERSQTEAQKQ